MDSSLFSRMLSLGFSMAANSDMSRDDRAVVATWNEG